MKQNIILLQLEMSLELNLVKYKKSFTHRIYEKEVELSKHR